MGRETIFTRYAGNKVIPLTDDYTTAEPDYYFCGRDELSTRIYSHILQYWRGPKTEEEENELEAAGEGDFLCPHLTFILSDKKAAPPPEELGIRDFEPTFYIDGLKNFAHDIVDSIHAEEIESYNHLNRKIDAAWKAAENAPTLETFEEFLGWIDSATREADELNDTPADEVFNILHKILFEADTMKVCDGQVLRIFVSD